ncbi:APC family permease [Halococcus agarilyticus]|uniref:APC family permease n=1 Tax=Halococcus agarilyticus TaxID=1232219 RepID=UPI0006778BDF|nr:APC family permease [Halococcus agarilyticus]
MPDATNGGGVTLLQAVAIEVGLIVGGALFSLTGVAVGIAGAGVVVAFGLALGIAILGLIPTAMLGSLFPTTGGNYRYPARFVSVPLAFLAAWGLGISMLGGGLPLYALTAGQYVAALTPVAPTTVGVVLLTAFFLLNLLGIRLAAIAQVLMFVVLVGALGMFVVFGVPAVQTANLTPLFPNGAVGVVTAAGILYFVCLGANFVVDIGGDVRDATVAIPQSFALSIPLVLVLYVGVGVVAVGAVGADAMANAALTVPAERFLSGTLQSAFVVGGALFAIATSMNAVFIITPKYLEVLAADGLFPALLTVRNERFGTPHWGLTLIYGLSVAMLLSPLPVANLGSLLSFGGVFLVVPVMLAAIAVVRTHGTVGSSAVPLAPRTIGAAGALAVVSNLVLLVLVASQSPAMFAIWLTALSIGGCYYLVRTRFGSQTVKSTRTEW